MVMKMIHKIISGGQTGADRAALDFAIRYGIPHGGWCPRGRWAEEGVIPACYQLTETPSADPQQRTEWNVRDGDATIIFSLNPPLTAGSLKTAEFASSYGKPTLHLSRQIDGAEAAAKLAAFLRTHKPGCVNIAGPRESEEPHIATFVNEVLQEVCTKS